MDSSAGAVQAPCSVQVDGILEEVLYLPELVVPQAAASLRQLLMWQDVASGYLRALDAIRMPQQLQAALRQIWAKATPVQRLAAVGPLTEWIAACIQVAPAHVTTQDRHQALQALQSLLSKLPNTVNWIGLAYEIIFDAPEAWDHTSFFCFRGHCAWVLAFRLPSLSFFFTSRWLMW